MENKNRKKGQLIEEGIDVFTLDGSKVTLNYLISEQGGQGDVYHVSYMGKDYAMKWYCKNPEDVIGGLQHKIISEICGISKKPGEKFIWPLYQVTEANPREGKRFGYLMELFPDNYYEMDRFLQQDGAPGAVRFKSYNAMLVAGMNIASAMQKLHLKGYSYKDLNPKNIVINPETGDVLIIDNDNVSVSGAPCTVKGMKGYMAPEIPRSGYREIPSRTTDFFSLAVILYRLFFFDHPMEGKLWDEVYLCTDRVEEILYAIKPVFHFDPQNDINRPTDVYAPNALQRWKAMPLEIRKLFIAAFTDGIDDPGKRPPEGVWINTIAKCRDKLIRLNPTREQFVNLEEPRSIPPRCLAIKIGSHQIALYPQKAIYQISVDGDHQQYTTIVAGILYNKQLDSLMIRNMSNSAWRGWSPKTRQRSDILPHQDYPICPGVMIEFQKDMPRIVGEVFDPLAKQDRK